MKALTGESIGDRCFVCGPKGSHRLPLLPEYPIEWNYFLDSSRIGRVSRYLNNLFSLTALGVHDGDFMHFSSGISTVTLTGGRTYHRIIPTHEGDHAIRWFIHDPRALFETGLRHQIPLQWIHNALAGLERVNPFIHELENFSVYDNDNEMALQIYEPNDIVSDKIAAVISCVPSNLSSAAHQTYR